MTDPPPGSILRSRSVLTVFAQDSGTHNLVYANADISKATQHREVIAFCDHRRRASGKDPHMLIGPGPHRRAAHTPARIRHRHPRRRATPLPRNPCQGPGQIITTDATITVRLDRRTSPILRHADLPDTAVPWWAGRTLRYEFA